MCFSETGMAVGTTHDPTTSRVTDARKIGQVETTSRERIIVGCEEQTITCRIQRKRLGSVSNQESCARPLLGLLAGCSVVESVMVGGETSNVQSLF